jgi:DNA-binding transcriptional MerR regulator
MKIGELSKRSGVSIYTLRYYERVGLLPFADRNSSGQRDYDTSIITWIAFLLRLKTTGMSIQAMLRYSQLRDAGAGTEAERKQILIDHRERVRAHVDDLKTCLTLLDNKIASY